MSYVPLKRLFLFLHIPLRMMASEAKRLSKVYLVSQLHLYDEVKRLMPKDALNNLVNVNMPEFKWENRLNADQMKEIKDAEILLIDNNLLPDVIYNLPKLKWIHSTWAGVDPVFKALDENKPKPSFILTRHSGEGFSNAMAEYVVCQILNWERNFRMVWDLQKEKKWVPDLSIFHHYRNLDDLCVGILGVGNMGASVAKFLKQRGAKVIGLARSPRLQESLKGSNFDRIVTDYKTMLNDCDYICNLLPSTKNTIGLLNGDALKQCKKKPVFINCGRGNIIRTEDLINALKKEWISGAVLDVFEQEPLPPDCELWKMPQVTITPHIAAISKNSEISKSFVDNYKRYIAGEELLFRVDWDAGY